MCPLAYDWDYFHVAYHAVCDYQSKPFREKHGLETMQSYKRDENCLPATSWQGVANICGVQSKDNSSGMW